MKTPDEDLYDPALGASLSVLRPYAVAAKRLLSAAPLSTWPTLCMHVTTSSAELVRRVDLARELREAGVESLARKIESRRVGPGKVLWMLSFEEVHVVVGEPGPLVVLVASQLDDEPAPLCFR